MHNLTSRRKSDLSTYFAIDHGIGSVVVTCSALLKCKTSVKRSSITACNTTLNKMLIRLSAITKYHGGRPPFLEFRAPPVRVGKAEEPWVLILTITLGRMESMRRNSNEGTRKNIARMASVPTISTLRGGKERTIVLQV